MRAVQPRRCWSALRCGPRRCSGSSLPLGLHILIDMISGGYLPFRRGPASLDSVSATAHVEGTYRLGEGPLSLDSVSATTFQSDHMYCHACTRIHASTPLSFAAQDRYIVFVSALLLRPGPVSSCTAGRSFHWSLGSPSLDGGEPRDGAWFALAVPSPRSVYA